MNRKKNIFKFSLVKMNDERELINEIKKDFPNVNLHVEKERKIQKSEKPKIIITHNINWGIVSRSERLSEEFIEKFQDKVNWKNISFNQRLSEDFIEKFQDKVNWENISKHQKLSEEFIEKFQDKVDWDGISTKQLSEEFIEKYQDKLNWYNISFFHDLTEEFIEKFQDKLNMGLILYLGNYPKELKEICEEYNDLIS